MAASTSASISSPGGGEPRMKKHLLEAAMSGDIRLMRAVASQDPSILLGTTPQGNNCLHISSTHGHREFCTAVLEQDESLSPHGCKLDESLLMAGNLDFETPLVVAVKNGHVQLAIFILGICCKLETMRRGILQQDRYGFNVLHHAIRCGHQGFALELIKKEPDLSLAVNKFNESPMYSAAVRNFTHVVKALLDIQDSGHEGPVGGNALHAAVRNGHTETCRIIMRVRPEMARGIDKQENTPLGLAVLHNKIEVLQELLERDCSLGYEVSVRNGGATLLQSAAYRGHVDIAREILKHCPDAPYRQANGWTCLHSAVVCENAEFVEFVLKEAPQLGKIINMQDKDGKTALHHAVQKCNPRIVAALLAHEDIDVTVQDSDTSSAAWELWDTTDNAKTLNWNEVCMLMAKADPQGATALQIFHMEAKQKITMKSRKDAKALTQTYTANTSLVAILITTITFAAAFTLPGGNSSVPQKEGLPIMSQKASFKAFIISDTLAMCSSFAVAFICIIARWEDYEFLIYYRSFTKKLMWFAYVATTTAFSTGLYTVLASHLHWLAIAICVLVALLPIITWLLGKWPVLKLRFRLGKSYRSDLLDMV